MDSLDLSLGMIALFLAGGAVAGFIDSIAGGGGLITLPLLSIVLGPGVHAIATNKIVGTVGAFAALVVYARSGGLDWKQGASFCVTIALGSFTGSLLAPHLPEEAVRWLLIALCPVLLYIVWQKNRWLNPGRDTDLPQARLHLLHWPTIFSGFACGIYDGAFGPGGGTFMFLALAIVARFPIFQALAISKLANTLSAGTSLVSYAAGGYVHWAVGVVLASGMLAGAVAGSNLNLKRADVILRPVLALAVSLLLARLLMDT